MPLAPGEEGKDGLEATMNRIYFELNKKLPGGLEMLAIVPNKIRRRIDHNNTHRELLEQINTQTVEIPHTGEVKDMGEWVPNFAFMPEEVWEAIDAGELSSNPKPGIREDEALNSPVPLSTSDPNNSNLVYFEEIADIIRYGGVRRDSDVVDTLLREHGKIEENVGDSSEAQA